MMRQGENSGNEANFGGAGRKIDGRRPDAAGGRIQAVLK